MMLRNWRMMLSATAAVLGMTVPILIGTDTTAHAAVSACAAVAGSAPSSLCVESSTDGATTAPYMTTVHRGDRINDFKWLVNEDNSTGDPAFTAANVASCLPARAAVDAATAATNPALAIYQTAGTQPLANCPWPSVHASAGHSTVIASGNQSDVGSLSHLPNGKYLISVIAAGHKIDGVHFAVAGGVITSVNEEPGAPFIVRMNPLPKKTATVRVHVYNDNASTNGQWDGQTETLVTCADATPQQVAANCGGSTDPNLVGDPSTDMSGFSVAINDVLAETTTDVYGNPLCTQYETDATGNVLLNDDGTPNPVVFGDPGTASALPHAGGASGSAVAGTESTCISDHYGDIVIPNMGPNRYAVTVIPPDPRTHNGDKWVQTTTLEGGHDWDSWNIEGGTGYDTELIVGGERVTPVAHGFVKLTHPDQVWNDAETAKANGNPGPEAAYYDAAAGFTGGTPGIGVLSGTVAIGRAYIGSGGASPLAGTNLANAKKDGVIKDGLVSISCLATCSAPTDTTIWTGRSRSDGTFKVTGLQTGDYSVAFWDETQSHIMDIEQYRVAGNPTQAALPAVTSATRTGPAIARVYTLNFVSDPGVITGQITLVGGNNGWSGTFDVISTTGNSVSVVRTPAPQPTGSANVVPQAFAGPFTNPAPTDVGDILLPGWFTDIQGSVFNDVNGNGIRDPGEKGIPDFVLTERTRGNSLQDQGAAVAKTNDEGTYDLSQGYPLGQFLIAEAYNPRFKNTGYTYTTDNDPTPHTVLSSQVDVDFLPIIGLAAKLDWGVQAYGTGTDYWSGDGVTPAPKDENGGIVGTVTYDVTRNEFDPAFSVQEDYQPGVAGIPMQLWKTHKTDGVHADKYVGSGAVQQWGITADGAECVRPDTSRGTNAVIDASQGCKPYDYYVTESWTRPTGCRALDVNGNKLQGELALPDSPALASGVDFSHSDPTQPDCIESPMSSFQLGGDGTVDGNYALTSLIHAGTLAAGGPGGPALEQAYADAQNTAGAADPLTSGDYVVEAVNPVDTVNTTATSDPTVGGYLAPGGSTAKKLYRFTDEKAINVMSGDTYVPQDGYAPSGGAGGGDYSLTVPTTKVRHDVNSLGAGTVAKCAGGLQTLPTQAELAGINPDLAAAGGSPYAGREVRVCDAKLVTVAGGRSMNPGFFVYTDVPIPSKFYGLVNDDLNVNVDRRSVLLGEVAPASNVPVGIYDENGNWKLTAHSDVNGFYEALLPSMDTYNCPLPAGPCANVYRLVGNDPGTLAHKNLDYNPQFRTIATEFQAWTGVVHPVDQAPTHNGITIEGPAAQFGALSLCKLADTNPTLFAIDKPYYDPVADTGHSYTIKGSGFGAGGTLSLGGTNVATTSWTDTQITFAGSVPAGLTPGPYQLTIRNNVSGLSTVNGLTFHRLSPNSGTGSTTYLKNADVYEVTPAIDTDNAGARQYTPVHDAWDSITNTPVGFFGTDVNGASVGNAGNTGATSPNGRAIQRAVQAAYNASNNGANAKLVVIYPNTAPNYVPHNPNAAYFENVVLHGKVKLQGVGPGGANSSTNIVNGTNIDASQFWSATQVVPPGGNQDTADGSYSDDWRTFANAIPRVGSTLGTELPEGAGVTAIAQTQNQYGGGSAPGSTTLFRSGVDGVLLTGGNQQGNPGNINTLPGGNGDTVPGVTNPGPAQGGAIMTDQYVRDFNITNDSIQSNGGTYGTIRIGTPDLPGNANESSNHNDRLNVAFNRIVANGGTNLAGALGLFAGSDGYTVTGNDFCGNFSAEYGGGISHYGLSPNGNISKNRIYYNQGYDEGGGIMIAGALPANTSQLSFGAGPVTIDSNTLISNQSNDDGGGIRFLMAGNFPDLVENNIIANNLSTHEGGGIALDDAPNVTLVNNTIAKNITTATAATNGAVGGIKPANPAGLSTGYNSTGPGGLQGTLPLGSPLYSEPKMFNNIFADNRAGWAILPSTVNFNQSAMHGIGDPLDTDPIQRWDMGVVGGTGAQLHPTNSVLNSSPTLTNATSAGDIASSPTNIVIPGSLDGATASVAAGGVGFVNPQDFLIDSLMWRNNTNASFPVIVAHMVPVNLLADYHLAGQTSRGYNLGAASKAGGVPSVNTPAPTHDIDSDVRPAGGAYDSGADEISSNVTGNLEVAVNGPGATVTRGQALPYVITVTNAGASAMQETFSSSHTGTFAGAGGWTCATTGAGSSCGGATGLGDISSRVITVGPAGTVTFTSTARAVPNNAIFGATFSVTGTLNPNVVGFIDTNAADNTSTLSSSVVARLNLSLSNTFSVVGAARMFTVVTTNSGADSATGVGLSDPLPAGIAFSWSCASTGGGTNSTNCGGSTTGTGAISRNLVVPSGGSVTFTCTATRSPAGPAASVTNVATATEPANSNQAAVTNSPASATGAI